MSSKLKLQNNILIFRVAILVFCLHGLSNAQVSLIQTNAPSEKFPETTKDKKSYSISEGVIVGDYWLCSVNLKTFGPDPVPFSSGLQFISAETRHLVLIDLKNQTEKWLKPVVDDDQVVYFGNLISIGKKELAGTWILRKATSNEDVQKKPDRKSFVFELKSNLMSISLNPVDKYSSDSHPFDVYPVAFLWLKNLDGAKLEFSKKTLKLFASDRSQNVTLSYERLLPHTGLSQWREPVLFLIPGNEKSQFYTVKNSKTGLSQIDLYDMSKGRINKIQITARKVEEACDKNNCTYIRPAYESRHPIGASWFIADFKNRPPSIIRVSSGKIDLAKNLNKSVEPVWLRGSENGRFVAVVCVGEKPDQGFLIVIDSKNGTQCQTKFPDFGEISVSFRGITNSGRLAFSGRDRELIVLERSGGKYVESFSRRFFAD